MKNCYPQLLLEKYKYIVKEEKIKKYMSDDLEVYFKNSNNKEEASN